MKNDPSSSLTAVQHSGHRVRLAPLRQTVTALFVASLISGCVSLKNPESTRFTIPDNTSEFKNRLYTGVALGNSHLSPNTRGEGFSVDSSSDMGAQLRLGYDVHNMLAVEVDTSVLGTSQLRSRNAANTATAEVNYSAATVSALVYGWSGVQNRSRRERLSVYGRFGFSALNKSSNVVDLEENGTVPILGIGAEYGFTNGLGIRTELTRFDSDVTYFGFGAIYRFGISPQGIGRMIAQAAEPSLAAANTQVRDGRGYSDKETVVERYAGPNARPSNSNAPHLHYTSGAEPNAEYVGTMADRWRPAMRSDDLDRDGVGDHADSCPGTNKHVTVDRHGCGLFDAVLHEVTFKSASRWLTPRARKQLDLLADTLLAFPESRIQIRAHTDSQGAADMNLGLSSRRAEVVVQYLLSKGVHELQLQAVGMGEAQPLDSNRTRQGRRSNRRVDIVTLPDQDAGQLLVASNLESSVVTSVPGAALRSSAAQGTLAALEDWNSAPRFGSKKRAAPATDRMVDIKPQVAPLPQPGYAPNFQINGVLAGVEFVRGDSTLSDSAQQAMQPLLNQMLAQPAVRVAIMAHTDNQGSVENNKQLSTQRADAVVDYLVENGVDASRLKAEGYGELLPLVQNMTEADRKRNRRIEVRVLPSGP